jgi:ketosteroid isomerase-like protein
MSQENVEIVRPIYEAFAEGKFGLHTHLLDPQVEYAHKRNEADVLVGEWHGVEAMVATIAEWMQTVEDLRIEAERYIDAGDSVVVFTRYTAVNRTSRLPFEENFADVITLRDGRIVRWHIYRHRDEALEAVRLSE